MITLKLKTCSYCFALCLILFSNISSAELIDIKKHNDVIYYLLDSPARIEVYSITDGTFQDAISLPVSAAAPTKPTSFHVDESGFYVTAWDVPNSIFLYHRDFTDISFSTLANPDVAYTGLTGNADYLVGTNGSTIQVINKTSGTIAKPNSPININVEGCSLGNGGANPNYWKAYCVMLNQTPRKIAYVRIDNDGQIGDREEITSFRFETHSVGNKTFLFPDESRIMDNSGSVYNSSLLTHVGDMGGYFQDMVFWNDTPIVLRDNKLVAYQSINNVAWLETTSIDVVLPNTANHLFLHLDNLYIAYLDASGAVAIEVTPVASLSPQTAYNDPPHLLAQTPDKIVGANDIVYVLSHNHAKLFRWSVSTKTYLEPIVLKEQATDILYHPRHNALFLSYRNGDITRIDLSPNSDEQLIGELIQTTPISVLSGLITAADHLVAISNYGNLWVVDKDGNLLSRSGSYSGGDSYYYSKAKKKIYYVSRGYEPNDIYWQELDPITGEFGEWGESPYHDSTGMVGPVHVSKDGVDVILGSGRIFNSGTLELNNTRNVSSNKTMIWANGNLAILSQYSDPGTTRYVHYDANYDAYYGEVATGSPIGLVNVGKDVIVITEESQILQFHHYSPVLVDTDGDGYTDDIDAFPKSASEWQDTDGDLHGDNGDAFPNDATEWYDSDRDGVGDNSDMYPRDSSRIKALVENYMPIDLAGEWHYSNSLDASKFGDWQNHNGHDYIPFQFSHGTQLYFNVDANAIYLQGYKQIRSWTSTGEVEIDVKLDAPLVFMASQMIKDERNLQGTATVSNSLDTGSQNVDYTVKLEFLGLKPASALTKGYEAFELRMRFVVPHTISGGSYSVVFYTEIFLVEGIGIAHIRDGDIRYTLTQTNKTAIVHEPSPGSGGGTTPTPDGSDVDTGGGSGTFNPYLCLLIYVYVYRRTRNTRRYTTA